MKDDVTGRSLRLFETAPDNYVEFRQSQKQWVFSYKHPWLWAIYKKAAQLRCLIFGHELSPIWEEEKFDLSRLGHMTTHCVFCGKSSDDIPKPTGSQHD